MNMLELLIEIENFHGSIEPNNIKLIVGKSNLSYDVQSKYDIIGNIDIYKHFKHCAFVVEKWKTSLNDAECCVWSLLLDISLSESKDFLNNIKSKKMENKLIEWLYFKQGIIMINRQGYAKDFRIFKKYQVSHVLIVSDYSYKVVLSNFDKLTKVGIVPHPSKQNWGILKDETWGKHTNKHVKSAILKDFTFDKLLLEDFIIYE